jgi:hypothetical protein
LEGEGCVDFFEDLLNAVHALKVEVCACGGIFFEIDELKEFLTAEVFFGLFYFENADD